MLQKVSVHRIGLLVKLCEESLRISLRKVYFLLQLGLQSGTNVLIGLRTKNVQLHICADNSKRITISSFQVFQLRNVNNVEDKAPIKTEE